MAKDILKIISQMQKVHDYYGKGKDAYGKIDKVHKATKIAIYNFDSIRELYGSGYKAAEVKKLILTLDKRAKIAEQAAIAAFPVIKSSKNKMWVHWANQTDKYGPESKESQSARKYYLKILIRYDEDLLERINYCQTFINVSERQVTLYTAMSKYVIQVKKLCETMIAMPEIYGSGHKSEAWNMYTNLNGMAPSCKKIAAAHKKLIKTLMAEQKRVKKIKKVNDIYISDMRKTDITRMLKKAMKAMGVDIE